MKITVKRDEFASTFNWAYRGLPPYAIAPILLGMRFDVEHGKLALSVFDYERATRGWVTGHSSKAGHILVNSKGVKKIVETLPKGQDILVDVTADTNTLTIVSGGITWTLPALPADEYPELPDLPPMAGVIDGTAFAKSITRVAAAAGRDDTLPVLTCIRFTSRPDALYLAATDRYRIAFDNMPWVPASADAEPVVANVPRAAAEAFARAAGKTGKVSVYLSPADTPAEAQWVGLRDDSHELITRTMQGEVPKYERMLRADSPINVLANAHALADVVNRIGKIAEKNQPVCLHYADGVLTVSVQGTDDEPTAFTTVDVEADTEEPFKVLFNPAYLASMLQGFNGTVNIGLAGELPTAPLFAQITPAGGTDDFMVIIVPVKQKDAK